MATPVKITQNINDLIPILFNYPSEKKEVMLFPQYIFRINKSPLEFGGLVGAQRQGCLE